MDRFALPGFQPPFRAKENERVFGTPAGKVEVVFLKNCPLNEPLRSFEVFFSKDRGTELNLMAAARTNAFVLVKTNDSGTKDYCLRFQPDELLIYPGTYNLRILEKGVLIFEKTLTVKDGPEMPIERLFDTWGTILPD